MRKVDFDIENIGQWPASIRWLVITIIFGTVVFSGVMVDTKLQLAKLSDSVVFEKMIRNQLAISAENLKTEKISYQAIKQLEKENSYLLNSFPTKIDLTILQGAIAKMAKQNNLAVKFIKPRAEIKYDIFSVVPLRLKVKGGHHQLAMFFSEFESMNKPMRITGIRITPEKFVESGELSLNKNMKLELRVEFYMR